MLSETEHPRLAVMFTDIQGYSRMMSEDESTALRVLAEHNQIMESVIPAHGGRIIKKLGDSYMVIFDDGDTAMRCGLHALSKLAARNRKSEKSVEIRVGIHEGPMLERDGDFFGEHVNIAARLEQMAKPMTIHATERVIQQVSTRIKAEARFIGALILKNLRYPVSVYAVIPADAWKLYLTPDGPAAETESADLLGDVTSPDAAWTRIGELIIRGNLPAAARHTEATLSKFGGTYDDYALLASTYLIARMDGEAQAALKTGEMLGRKTDETTSYDWLHTLVAGSVDELKRSPANAQACMRDAQEYVSAHSNQLVMRVLVEDVKARLTGHLGGLESLAQQHQDKALVLRGYAEALKNERRDADAYNLLEQTIAVAPEVADHQLRRAQWLVESEDINSVLAESDKLAKKFPEDPRVYDWTGQTRLLNLDPLGAQWIFEQKKEGSASRAADSNRWLICSLFQQGRFEQGFEAVRKEVRSAIRQDHQRAARHYLQLALIGAYLDHWDGVLEILEEYKRYDQQWLVPRAALIVTKHKLQLMPWERALTTLEELSSESSDYPHPSGLPALSLLPVVQSPSQWDMLHNLEFFQAHRDWIINTEHAEAAGLEARGALKCDRLETWHLGLVDVLTRLPRRLDHRLPSFLALAGLVQSRLGRLEEGKACLEQARKLWRNSDWPVWELQEAESVLAAGASSAPEHHET